VAGIGFELRKLLRRDTFSGLMMAYAYAGVISSGPWVLSIVAVLIIGIFSVPVVIPPDLVRQFQTILTTIIAISLVLSGLVQLSFTRYCADRIFKKEHGLLLPNLNGLLLLVNVTAAALAIPLVLFVFPGLSLLLRLLIVASFVTVCNVWIATILLSGLKAYKAILFNFLLGYGLALVLAWVLRHWNLEGLLLAFLVGQFVLFKGMLYVVYQGYPSRHFIQFDFLRSGRMYLSLVFTGFFYNIGIWIDKIVFWYHPWTGEPVVGMLRGSPIYDLPVFIAYLTIIPGMAVFLMRIETDFVEYYDHFYDAVREGGSLGYIQEMKDEMVRITRDGIYDIMKIQGIVILLVVVAGGTLLQWVGISRIHLPLLQIQVVATGFQVVFLGLLNVFFYLDRRNRVLLLTGLFMVLNGLLSFLSIQLGPFFYGYGFALSLVIAVSVGMVLLDRDLDRLEYETFMLQ